MTAECNQFVFGFHPQKRREIRAQFDGGASFSTTNGRKIEGIKVNFLNIETFCLVELVKQEQWFSIQKHGTQRHPPTESFGQTCRALQKESGAR
jgi:hypothetical protein